VFAAVSDVSLKLTGDGRSVWSASRLRETVTRRRDAPDPVAAGRIAGGRSCLRADPFLTEKELVGLRGNEISMVFQEPMTSLNPVFTTGDQVAEVYRIHLKIGKKEALERAVGMLEKVGIPDPARRAREYPHQMSGGMRQRVLIAIALACRPKLLIADEPTTALDVTIQAQILTLMEQLRDEMGTALLLITHDLGVVAESADDVAVMYAGRIVEQAACRPLFEAPWHPYTAGLLHSRPVLGRRGEGRHLDAIPGTVPDPKHLPPGCSFEPRCPRRKAICAAQMPGLEQKPASWPAAGAPP
jgi:oligopeptide/dipeptide ABC transporter ATP-binding protein